MILFLLACSGSGSDSAAEDVAVADWCADAVSVTYENFGEGFMLTHCQGCHASDTPERFDAPESVTFDTEEDIALWRESIVRVIFTDASMPPAGGLTEEELTLAEIWLECDR